MERLRNKKIYVESYGCTFNHADTQKLIGIAESMGCRQVPPDKAEVFIINTCTVVGSTERTMLRRIRAFRDREILVAGCLPVVQADLLRSEENVTVILPKTLAGYSSRVGAMVAPATGVVQMGTGCLGTCSYCITRHARGRLISHSRKTICTEVERLISEGAAEIQLTGQDVSAYGQDRGTNLAELLGAIDDIPGDFRVRVGMMNPATVLPILDDLPAAFNSEKIFRFVHLPVQSGSDRVLAAMHRGYTREDFISILEDFRNTLPDIRVSTDFIVGFPTETDSDFLESVDLLQTTRPTKVNITRYSKRPGTVAARYRDLTDSVKKVRSRALTKAANSLYDEVNETLIGREFPVMVTEKKVSGTVITRDPTYMNVVVREELPFGLRCNVMITDHHRHYLIGERVPSSF
jgi:threonylcarbamoyladenosine tRNA methylthiotransferase CDKAL1